MDVDIHSKPAASPRPRNSTLAQTVAESTGHDRSSSEAELSCGFETSRPTTIQAISSVACRR